MLVPVAAFLLVLLFMSRGVKGPLWALGLSWLVCVTPIATGAVKYRYLLDKGGLYSLTLMLFIGAFVLGYLFYETVRRTPSPGFAAAPPSDSDFARSFRNILPVARVCWYVAMFATVLNYVDFTLLGGAGLDDLAALRDTYANKASASVFAQIASILTWACLFCYVFALFFRRELGSVRFVWLLLPILGYFSLSVFSAGRQAAFQIMIVSLLVMIVTRLVRGPGPPPVRRTRRHLFTPERIGIAAVVTAMAGYMGYVAVARNDGGISDDKSQVLMAIFEFQFSPLVERITQAMGTGLRGAIVEGVVYFSSPPALFDPFLTIDWPTNYWGAMTFPFVFRQLEPLTGLSVTGGLTAKVDAINGVGVLGAGWATSMSSYIIDFGFGGTLVFIFLMGAYSAFAWRKALAFASFYYVIIGVLVLMNVIYMPLTPGVSETNLFILWLFCIFMHKRPYRRFLPLAKSRTMAAA